MVDDTVSSIFPPFWLLCCLGVLGGEVPPRFNSEIPDVMDGSS